MKQKPFGSVKTTIGNERGVVLVVAMVLLAVLTFVGLAAIFNSSVELRRSGDYRTAMEVFYSAEAAIETIKNDGYYATTTTSMDFPAAAHPDPDARSLALGDTTASGTIRFVTSGNPPPGYGFSAKDSSASYFIIEATGTASGVTHTQEELTARILPKSGG